MKKNKHTVDDHVLWEEITKSITPLFCKSRHEKKHPVSHPPYHGLASSLKSMRPAVSSPSTTVPSLTGFDRRTAQKMVRGKVEIDSRLDLHSLGLEAAYVRLFQFLHNAQARQQRLVLVITGKGASPFAGHTLHGRDHFHAPEREGKLRRSLPLWLNEEKFRTLVTGFQPAHPKHGGGGAFYIRLRRQARSLP